MIVYYLGAIFIGAICLALMFTELFFIVPAIPVAVLAAWLIYRFPIIGMVLLLFFVPFETLFDKYPILSVTKLVGFGLIALSALYIAQGRIQLSYIFNRNILIPLLFLLFVVASSFFSIHKGQSVDYIRKLMNSVAVFLIVLVMFEQIKIKVMLYALALSVSVSALLSLLIAQDFSVEQRGSGFVADPNYYALLILFVLPIAIYGVYDLPHKFLKLLSTACVICLVVALGNTYSRAAMLISLLLLAFTAFQNRHLLKYIRAQHMGIVFLVVFIGAIGTMVLVPASMVERLSTLTNLASGTTNEDRSLGRRSSYILVGKETLLKNPILGSGPGTFPIQYAYSGYSKIYSVSKDNPELFRRAHNTYVEIFAETGILGGMSFLAILASTMLCLNRARIKANVLGHHKDAEMITVLMYSFLSMLIFMLFLSAPYHKYLWFIAAVAIAYLHQQRLRSAIEYD